MITKDSYVVNRDGKSIWLSYLVEPLPTDEIVEVRTMLIADDGLTLLRDGVEVGDTIWLKDSKATDYTEDDAPIIDEENEGLIE